MEGTLTEARREQTEYGRTAADEGWFVVNVRDAAWMTNEYFGEACVFEGHAVRFPQVGYTIHVLARTAQRALPPRGDQEDFLVLAGECIGSSKVSSGGCGPGILTARPAPSTSSSAPARAPA